jgi:PAS domain-containing protein
VTVPDPLPAGERPPPAVASERGRRPAGPDGTLRRLEPLAAAVLGLYGLVTLADLDAAAWQWAGAGLLLALGLAGLGGRNPVQLVALRAAAILVVGAALLATTDRPGDAFQAWPFVLVALYPLVLPGGLGNAVAVTAALTYLLVLRLATPRVGPAALAVRWTLLAGLGVLAWTAAAAYGRMASVALQASIELERRERVSRSMLDSLRDRTFLLDPRGRIVAGNPAWTRFTAEHPDGPTLGAVGDDYPRVCAAAAAGGYQGLEAAGEGIRRVLSGRAPAFEFRYRAPARGPGYEVAVAALADGAGAVVSHRDAPGAG